MEWLLLILACVPLLRAACMCKSYDYIVIVVILLRFAAIVVEFVKILSPALAVSARTLTQPTIAKW